MSNFIYFHHCTLFAVKAIRWLIIFFISKEECKYPKPGCYFHTAPVTVKGRDISFQAVYPPQFCKQDVSVTPWRSVFKFDTHIDYLDFGQGHSDFTKHEHFYDQNIIQEFEGLGCVEMLSSVFVSVLSFKQEVGVASTGLLFFSFLQHLWITLIYSIIYENKLKLLGRMTLSN